MTKKLIHIECSPRKKRSVSKMLAEKFIEYYRLAHPDAPVETLDVWNLELPEYDEFTANAKYRVLNQGEFTAEERARWSQIEKLFAQFAAGDVYLFSVPMWNFGIPYKLKHYIDLITQPKLAFEITDAGYKGLLAGRSAVTIYSRGGDYSAPPASLFDYQKPYLEFWLRFIGITDIRPIIAGQMLGDADARAASIENAEEAAIAQAARC